MMESLIQPLFTIVICSLVALSITGFYFYRSKKPSTACRKRTAPQPGCALPLIGHLHLLSGKELHKTVGDMADKYGPAFTLRFGSQEVLAINSWEMAKDCLFVHDKVFADRPTTTASKILAYNFAMFAFAPYGAYWREMRKIATIELLSNRRLDMLKHIRVSEVRCAIRELYNSWLSKGSAESGVLVDMKEWFGNLTLNISLRMVGGKRYFGPNADCGEEEAQRCQKVMIDFVHLFTVPTFSDTIPSLGWLDLFKGYKQAMKRTAKELDSIAGGWLEEHKQKKLLGGGLKQEQDFMDILLNILENAEISGFDADTITKATCLNLILAASDTTMVTLTWALCLLLNHPRVLKEVQIELDKHVGKDKPVEEADVGNLVFLQAVVKETLRLYPAGALNYRAAKEDCILPSTGYHVSAGTQLMVNTWKIQRDERVWANANDFQPERFLTGPHKDMDYHGQTHELIPFGTGKRVCAGISLAVRMLHYILALFLQSFEVSIPSNLEAVDMTGSNGLTNLKATPLEVLIRPRLDSKLYDV